MSFVFYITSVRLLFPVLKKMNSHVPDIFFIKFYKMYL